MAMVATNTEIYHEKYIAFIDMLGFSRMVLSAADDPAQRRTIIDSIERLKDTACDSPETGLLITYFSDCVVISSERSERGLFDIIRSITFIAENLLQIDVLVRGGLTVGSIHHSKDLMFGPGMLAAYEMERCRARHPCILVDDVVMADVMVAGCWTDGWFFSDDEEPDRHYLHYLREFTDYDPTPRSGLLVRDGAARLVRHYIARRLQAEPGSVRDKAVWLKKYWNETVGVRGILGMVDEVSDLTDPGEAPYRTMLMRLATGPSEPASRSDP
jgi:hypothetical protein